MLVFRPKTFLIVCAALLGGITDARAEEWLYFYPVTGDLSLGVDGRWTNPDSGERTRQTTYEERLNLQFSGFSLDPRFLTFDINLTPTLEQDRFNSTTGTDSTDSTLLNYGARFSALHGVPASPVSLNANFGRQTGETEGSLGNRSDIITESRGADLRWKFKPFPSTVSYSERSLDETFIPGFGQPPVEREQFLRSLTYRGKSRGMELYLQGNEFDDRTTLDQDYESQLARLSNNFHWGKNSSLTSRLEYREREGFNAEEKVLVDESLRLQHTESLYTTYRYGYRAQQRTTESVTQSANFGLNHRLYRNLTTSVALSGATTQADQLQQETYSGSLDFSYTKKFRTDLRVSANLGGGYSTSDRTGGALDFTESPIVPATGIVVLMERYIIWMTVIVTAPGCTPCLDGTDYLVEDAGGDFSQLRIPVGSSIIVGDTITVDYVYEPPTAEYYSTPYRIGARVGYREFAFYHSTTGDNQTFVSGPDPTAVSDRRTDRTGVEWNRTQDRNRLSASAERVHTETRDRTTTEYFFNQSLNYVIAPNATLTAGLSESFFRDGTDADAYSGDLSVRWIPAPDVSVTPQLSMFRRSVDPGLVDSFVKAGVDVRWRWRRLSGMLRYDHSQHDTDGAGRTDDRVYLKLTRKF